MIADLLHTVGVTAPAFAMVFMGIVLRRLRWIDDAFIGTASTLVFRGPLPALIFLSIVDTDLGDALQPGLIAFFALATLGSFLFALGWAQWRIPHAARGAYVQGAFRGNCAIVGLALAETSFGAPGVSIAGVLLGVVIIVYNTLATVVLTVYSPAGSAGPGPMARSIVTNPLIIAIVLAVPFAAFDWRLPQWLHTSTGYFAQLALPLALICIGGTLSLATLRAASGIAISASLMKDVWIPIGCTAIAWLVGYRGTELGVLFLFFACPTAAASYVMARAFQADHQLAATIIVVSTLASILTINVGLFALRVMGVL